MSTKVASAVFLLSFIFQHQYAASVTINKLGDYKSCTDCLFNKLKGKSSSNIHSWCLKPSSPYFKSCTDQPCSNLTSELVVDLLNGCSLFEPLNVENITINLT